MTFRGKQKGIIRRRKMCRHCKTIRFTVEMDEEILDTSGEQVFPRNDKRWPRKEQLSPKEEENTPPETDLPENPYL